MITKDQILAARDPHGFRPLVLGRLGDAVIVCSETCALDLIGATYVRDVEPGEVLVIDRSGVRSIKPFPPQPLAHCVFEHVYFARPDSYVFGRSVNEVRTEFGRQLARESAVDADVVVPIPDSGVCAAVGYSEQSGIPMRFGLIRNHYIGRTFIEPQQSIRHFGVKIKLNPVRSILEGKRVVLIDDSIVRGTTSRKIVKLVKAAGAREVHMRISCPPTMSPCFYGVDTPRRSELIAATHTLEEIQTYLRADSLAYLSLEGMLARGRAEPALVLHVVLHGPLSGRVPARHRVVPAARAEARQGGVGLSRSQHPRERAPVRRFRGSWLVAAGVVAAGWSLLRASCASPRPPPPPAAKTPPRAARDARHQAIRRSRICRPPSTSSASSITPPGWPRHEPCGARRPSRR